MMVNSEATPNKCCLWSRPAMPHCDWGRPCSCAECSDSRQASAKSQGCDCGKPAARFLEDWTSGRDHVDYLKTSGYCEQCYEARLRSEAAEKDRQKRAEEMLKRMRAEKLEAFMLDAANLQIDLVPLRGIPIHHPGRGCDITVDDRVTRVFPKDELIPGTVFHLKRSRCYMVCRNRIELFNRSGLALLGFRVSTLDKWRPRGGVLPGGTREQAEVLQSRPPYALAWG